MAIYLRKRDMTVSLLRDAIIQGRLEGGTHLGLEALSSQYEVSVTPLREALQLLVAEGFVVQLPHKGFIVASMDRDELEELYTIRMAMEMMATRRAVPHLTDEILTKMASFLARMETVAHAAPDSWDKFHAADRSFHLTLYTASGSKRWVQTIRAFWLRAERYMRMRTALAGGLGGPLSDHRRILEACRQRDVVGAVELIRDHIYRAQELLLEQWGTQRHEETDTRDALAKHGESRESKVSGAADVPFPRGERG